MAIHFRSEATNIQNLADGQDGLWGSHEDLKSLSQIGSGSLQS
jgi:hypothetical protein